MQNAIALIELKSIARGIEILDFMLKKAEVTLVDAGPFSGGKYFILIHGRIAEVEAAYQEGKARADFFLIDDLFIPDVHPTLLPAIEGNSWGGKPESCAIIETFTIAATIKAADAAAKTADVRLIKITTGKGIGGKGYFTLTGNLPSVEAATEIARSLAESEGSLISAIVIPNPGPEVFEKLL